MNPRQLRAFTVVAQSLSFVRAGEALHMSQPALSLSIRSLEEALGGALFTRTTRQVRLTPEGAALLPIAQRLLADWDNASEQLRQRFALQRGHVSAAAMPSFAGNVLPQLMLEYRRRHPGIQFAIHDVIHEDVLEMVASGRVEIGFGFQPETQHPLHFDALFRDRFIAVVSRKSTLARYKRVNWSQLMTGGFIALQRPSTVRTTLEKALRGHGIEFDIAYECHQLATVGQMVAAGLGVSAVPALCARQMSALGAQCLPLTAPIIERSVGLIRRADAELSTAARALREIAIAHFGKRRS
ncbi:LysR family transcriptional regulator [Solimonas marina]|uniref:LysR family transcriptional regulator n=1 Tax=Solimonas marina TaxID=2714601 RepID=A0A969WED3_9GAMM|nr:LysR family transcriptional regulator [Solimonas marina]NKF23220.1 LysR family transcriptional regulator [Solimonas marina]